MHANLILVLIAVWTLEQRSYMPCSDGYNMENSLDLATPSHSIKILFATSWKDRYEIQFYIYEKVKLNKWTNIILNLFLINLKWYTSDSYFKILFPFCWPECCQHLTIHLYSRSVLSTNLHKFRSVRTVIRNILSPKSFC